MENPVLLNSLPLHSVGVDEDRSSLENNGSLRDPYNILTINDITPIELARERFLDIMVDHFISSHVTEAQDSEVDYMSQTAQDKLSKRQSKEIQYEGDARFVLPLMYVANMYETLVNEVNTRLSSLNSTREKTISVALEAAGGLYRKLAKKFPRKGPYIFKRRELATSFETRSRFPELVIQEEKRVRFVVVNGLSIIEKPTDMHIDDAEWFKRLTGRNEVAVSARDYKFYAPRHKYRRVTPNSVSNIPGLPIFPGTDDSSPMARSQGYRSISEQTPSKQHMQTQLHQGQFHPLHPSHQPINQNQHVGHFTHNHQCGPPSHLPEIVHGQQSSTLSQHMACVQPLGHVGGRLHVLPQDCLGVLGPENNVAEYYQQQVEMLEGFNEMDALAERGFIPSMSKEERENLARSETTAIRISNFANMILFAAKVYASVRSGSLAIIASTLDSLLDLLSGFILWFTAFSMKSRNPYQYPIGKKRMQPLGILVFASVMATLGLQIILESVRTLASDDDSFRLSKEQERWVVGIMFSVTLVKLVLCVYCRSFANEIVKAYAQDHFFDVITNIIGLVAVLLANYIRDWMDPVGAIILALYTIRTWSLTVLENVNSLVGRSASPEYLQKLTYLCWNHHKAIKHIDTVRAYTFGSHYFVEVDIVLPADMPLQEAHDIGESLQEKLEQLPEIERAFVHLDYECSHKPEHALAHL